MPLPPGHTLLNKYRIESLTGEGASAQVYRVTHRQLKQPRALKVLRRDAPGVGGGSYPPESAQSAVEINTVG